MNAGVKLSAEALIEKYSDMVYRVAFSRTQNVSDAQDITQDVFLKYIKYEENCKIKMIFGGENDKYSRND